MNKKEKEKEKRRERERNERTKRGKFDERTVDLGKVTHYHQQPRSTKQKEENKPKRKENEGTR